METKTYTIEMTREGYNEALLSLRMARLDARVSYRLAAADALDDVIDALEIAHHNADKEHRDAEDR